MSWVGLVATAAFAGNPASLATDFRVVERGLWPKAELAERISRKMGLPTSFGAILAPLQVVILEKSGWTLDEVRERTAYWVSLLAKSGVRTEDVPYKIVSVSDDDLDFDDLPIVKRSHSTVESRHENEEGGPRPESIRDAP